MRASPKQPSEPGSDAGGPGRAPLLKPAGLLPRPQLRRPPSSAKGPDPRDGGWLRLPVAGTVIFRVRATNTRRVRFTLTPTGSNTADLTRLLGEDTDGRDGWTLAYRDRGGGHLVITAIGAGGHTERLLNVYRPEPAVAPRILSVTTSPVLPREGGFLRLPAGAGTVVFRVRAVNAQRVRFSMSPAGTSSAARLLGRTPTAATAGP